MEASGADNVAYLVNGLPSLLARRVLEQVLCFEPRARVYCIVHSDDSDYVERQLAQFELPRQSRVELLTGDLTALDFGLSRSEYLALARHVRRVHHVVSPGNLFVDASNVAEVGAALGREIVEFARVGSALQNVVVYSTASVSGDRTGTVLEDELVRGQDFPRAFPQALALMELILRRAQGEVPVVVVRPTLLTADSQTGECERMSPWYALVEAAMVTPRAQLPRPTNTAPLHLVAIDYVARAAYYLGRRSDTAGQTLHLADAHPTNLGHVLKRIVEACSRLGATPPPAAASAGQRPALPQQGQVWYRARPGIEWSRASAALRGPNVFYDTRRSQSLLAGSGIACPPFQDYADKLVDYVRHRRA